MKLTISKITDQLLSTEKILWHKKPEPKNQNPEPRSKYIPILIGAILMIISIALLIPSFLSQKLTTTDTLYAIILFSGLILMIVGLVNTRTGSKNVEYLITNKRVLIYPSPYSRGVRIINLWEVNGDIEMKYNETSDTGDIYIPSPHWYRFGIVVQTRMIINDKPIIDPDIKGIKDPYKVYNILIEAIQTGKRTHWK